MKLHRSKHNVLGRRTVTGKFENENKNPAHLSKARKNFKIKTYENKWVAYWIKDVCETRDNRGGETQNSGET